MNDADLDRLERYLSAEERSESTLPLDATQGLLAAVVSAPAPIVPSVWLPAVLGEEPPTEITELLISLHNDVAQQLNEGERFDFILYGGEGEDHESIAVWCEGYLMGVELADPGWEEGTDPEDLDELLFPFLMLSGQWKDMRIAAGEPPMDPAEEEKVAAELRQSLAGIVLDNRAYWFNRSIPQPVRRAAPKVGRNDPCPCGSGKKFKNCCGSG